jgi:hypothetical protein
MYNCSFLIWTSTEHSRRTKKKNNDAIYQFILLFLFYKILPKRDIPPNIKKVRWLIWYENQLSVGQPMDDKIFFLLQMMQKIRATMVNSFGRITKWNISFISFHV